MDLAPQTFTLNAGDTLEIPVANVDGDGAALDLTGASGRFGLARRPGGTPVVSTEISPANATWAIVGTATDGNSLATVASAVTAALLGTYYWEHVVVDASSNEVLTARGYVTIGTSTI